jgi:hypothetical protein
MTIFMTILQKIAPCLWFDDQAEEAVKFYLSIAADSLPLAFISVSSWIAIHTSMERPLESCLGIATTTAA